jgi:TonB family protein
MFDFAISQNQRQRPTKRIYASWLVSGFIHIFFLVMLIQYPQLLRGGQYHRFRPLSVLVSLFEPKPQQEDQNWRTVAVLRTPMTAPSLEALKKYLPAWSKKGTGSPPVRIHWEDLEKKLGENKPLVPKVRQDPKAPNLMPPPSEASSGSPSVVPSPAGNSAEPAAGTQGVIQADANAGKRGTVNLPPPGPGSAPKTEVAATNTPNVTSSSVKTPSAATVDKNSPVKVFENEQQAIRSSESGIFDAHGFPLDEYANLIKERIKGKWYIPSNLKNSQGHTTIVFYIGRDGRYANLRIVAPSGNSSLDLAAMKAVMDSEPFPALPRGFPGDHVGAKFVLSYNEP